MPNLFQNIFVANQNILRPGMRFSMVLLMSLMVSQICVADFQDKKPLRTRLSLTCTQLPENKLEITAKIRVRENRVYRGLAGVEIEIYNQTDSADVILGKKTSDKDGNILMLLDLEKDLQKKADGYYAVMVSYDGTEEWKSCDDELLFKPALFSVKAEEMDSVKTISIQIVEKGEDGIALADMEVMLEVPRMFSNLPIATESTDEDGRVEIEFPNDLPGGEYGELTIIAKVEDTDDHGSLRSEIQQKWGVPTAISNQQESGQLWSPNPPFWMVTTFIFLMLLVWVHLGIIVYKLYSIKKESREMLAE